MSVPLVDLKAQFATIEPEVRAAIDGVLASAWFILGPELAAFEQEIAEFCGVPHARGCGCGSDALMLSLWALGIGPGDEVVLPAFTFFATAGAVARLRARPVFADVDPITWCLDPESVASVVTDRTRAILPVHLFGQCAPIEQIEAALPRPIPIIEDAAQAIGARRHGRAAGSLGHAGCFSFFPSKNLGAMGDGGMITTGSEELAADLKARRQHGCTRPKYFHEFVGTNSRLDAMQAAILRVKLRHLPAWNEARRRHAARYAELFAQTGLDQHLDVPVVGEGNVHIYHQFSVKVRSQEEGLRDRLMTALRADGIGCQVYYPYPLHLLPAFSELGYQPGSLPHCEDGASRLLALPIFPELTHAQQDEVVGRLQAFFG